MKKILTDSKVTDQRYELSEFEQQKIANARKQVENGKIATQEEVFKKIDAWLKE